MQILVAIGATLSRIITSKRDTHKQISRCSLKTWSRAGYKLSTDLSRVTPKQKTVSRVNRKEAVGESRAALFISLSNPLEDTSSVGEMANKPTDWLLTPY